MAVAVFGLKKNRMIVIKLQGGLGNQMFQYAIGRSLITRTENVFIDLRFLNQFNLSTDNFTSRNYELGIFKNCKTRLFTNIQKKIFFDKRTRFKILRKLYFGKLLLVNQNENELVSIPTDFKNLYLDGFFQSEKYFLSIRNIIIKEFTFPILDNENIIIQNKILNDENSVGIHIRRGDYLKQHVLDYHGILPITYYIKAIEILKRQFRNLTFYFFSDDIDFVKESFNKIKEKVIVEGNSAQDSWKDMCLMKSCRHHIVANSSFSWWGAWLSERDGLNIAPSNWFNPKQAKFNINDFVPNNWKIIEYE